MSHLRTLRGHRLAVATALVAGLLPITLVAVPSGADSTTTAPAVTATTLTAPQIPGVAALPFTGVIATPATMSPTLGVLTVTPNQGVEGVPFTVSGTGLPPSTSVQLTWSTTNVSWAVDVEPNTVNYLGRTQASTAVVMATVTTDASGNFSVASTTPVDVGGIHDIYAVVNGVNVDHGGFELLRTVTMSPRSGPVGTPITITYTALGGSFYTGGASVLWDNHYVGEMMANWTRGTASATIRATGSVGIHYLQVGNAISYLYLNVIQSPIPYTNGATLRFRVTPGHASLTPTIDWPVSVAPTLSERTTLSAVGLDPASHAVANLSVTSGPVNTKDNLSVSNLPDSGSLQLVWSSVVGNRVNCYSTCWSFSSVPLGTATATNGRLSAAITIPNGLGGWHVVQVMKGTTIEAQVPFYVMESIVPFYNSAGQLVSMGVATANDASTAAAVAVGQSGTGQYTFKEGQEFTISIDGVGWTQLDNTLGVDYDNSYMGYGCGFNSNGYMVIHLHATGGPGVHLIDLYPMLYSLSPSFANTPYGMVPVLSYAHDYPGLALGYHVPSIRFAITIVK